MVTTITGSMVPQSQQIIWFAGGVWITSGDEERLEGENAMANGFIELENKAEYGSVVVLDANGVESSLCLEFQGDGTTPATQASGTEVVQTTASGTDNMYPDYIAIDGVGSALVEVIACKDVSFKMSADEYSESIQNQMDKVKATGAIGWDMSISTMDANSDFVTLAYGATTTDSPAAGQSKHHTLTGTINDIGTLVGTQYVSGSPNRKFFVMGCNVKSLSHDYPASGFSAKSFDFTVNTKREVAL